ETGSARVRDEEIENGPFLKHAYLPCTVERGRGSFSDKNLSGALAMKSNLTSRRALLLGAAALGFARTRALAAQANPGLDLGPAVNAKAPDIGMPLDHTGKPRSLASLMGDKGLVLFFVRSVV